MKNTHIINYYDIGTYKPIQNTDKILILRFSIDFQRFMEAKSTSDVNSNW